MADSNKHSQDQNQLSLSRSSSPTQRLRALTQSHLVEIEQDILSESQKQVTAHQEIQNYLKPKRKARSHSPSMQGLVPDTEVAKRPKLRSAQDVLHRLQWDPSINLDEYIIGYLERFEGMKEMPASSWIRESTDEDFIPQHRIKYVKREMVDGSKETVWDRNERIDRIFGSGKTDDLSTEDGMSEGGVGLV